VAKVAARPKTKTAPEPEPEEQEPAASETEPETQTPPKAKAESEKPTKAKVEVRVRKLKDTATYKRLTKETGAAIPIDVSFEGSSDVAKAEKTGGYSHVVKLEAPSSFTLLKTVSQPLHFLPFDMCTDVVSSSPSPKARMQDCKPSSSARQRPSPS